ncbi:MAG TPA: hypothetical protein VH120_00470 [Gemmataceae bacterium]|jgi:hypothetical protein|nr:hypothetical protein [Gemmataceae bacterium]
MLRYLLPLLLLFPGEDAPKPKWPIGKETTYVTGPFDKDGYIDYEAVLNERLGKGVTPENNANVLIWKVLGPRPDGVRMHVDYFKALGIVEPPDEGDYFVALREFTKDSLKLSPSEVEATNKQWSLASARPWRASDYPRIAAWLATNEKPLTVFVEATKRPKYFSPVIAIRNERDRGPLVSALLPSVQGCRHVVAALSARAMQRIGDGKFDDAWQDLLACHQLALHVSHGATLIESLVGYAFEQIVSARDMVYIARAPLTSVELRGRLREIRDLPRLIPVAEKVDLGERFLVLDATKFARRGGPGFLAALGDGKPPPMPDARTVMLMAAVDWGRALRDVNRWFDREVAIMRLADRAVRQKEMDKFFEGLKTVKPRITGPEDEISGESIGNTLAALFLPAVQKLQTAQDRYDQTRQNLFIAFVLAAYHADNGRYPPKLDDLAPNYLTAVPGDLFSGRPLIYRPTKNGYLLYSVGPNGVDDGGRSYADSPPGDDIVVRMPPPEPNIRR